jgi:hypothetical protein
MTGPPALHDGDMAHPDRHIRPIVGPADSWEPIEARFTCDRCGSESCVVTLLPPFGRDPQAPPPASPGSSPGESPLFQDTIRLSIDGPVKLTHTFLPGMTVDIAAIEAALRQRDPVALYAVDREYAPFWCRACGRGYCRACWVVWVDYDDGFYDCTRGRCPDGHERIMDD